MIQSVRAADFLDALPALAEFFRQFELLDEDPAIDLIRAITTGHRQCYVAVDDGTPIACILTSVRKGRDVCIEYAAGKDYKKWALDMVAIAEAHAAELGGKVRILGRIGWLRALDLKGRGYKTKYMVMESAHV